MTRSRLLWRSQTVQTLSAHSNTALSSGNHDLLRDAPAYSLRTSFQRPSEMTSTTPSTTWMAV